MNETSKKIRILPGEYWWGGSTRHSEFPLSEKSEYSADFRCGNGEGGECDNQTAPFFVSSKGRYIWSEEPFAVSVRNGEFEFTGGDPVLTEAGSTLREAYTAAQKAHFPSDGRKLRDEFFTGAQYNTWMEFTYYPTQEKVLEYAESLLSNGFEPGVLILDEGWHRHTDYGNWEFDPARFPDPKGMIDRLHALGFRVMLWVTPYVSPNGPKYVRSLWTSPIVGTDPESAKHLYMRTESGSVALVSWWNGYSAQLDFTNSYDVDFLDSQLRKLCDELGVDGFKFDGGTPSYYSDECIVNGTLRTSHTPYELNIAWNEFGRRYPFHEYKDTYRGGGKNVIQRLHDRNHSWTEDGIDALIPCAIDAGLIGHPFICPDMIGGGSWIVRHIPGFVTDEELFVRMAQCSALFPMMQFSWAPWKALSAENLALCVKAAALHRKMSGKILSLVRSAEQTGEPILRSLEYNDPGKGYAEVTDEFMLGEDILVAPVVTKGTVRREVVFPAGKWSDEDGNLYEGGTKQTLDAPLDKLLWFERA